VTVAVILLVYAGGVGTLGGRVLTRARWTARAPLLRDAEPQVARLAELHADDAATRTADPRELATALVALATPADATPAPALAAAATDAVHRIHRLLGPAEPLSPLRQHLLRATAASLALAPVLMALTPAVAALVLGRVPAA
jgi:hypothetical protein